MRRITDGNMILPPISEVRAAGAEVLLQQVFRHQQTVRTVADRTEPPRGFCPQPLAAQTGRHRFDIEGLSPGAKFIRQAWHPIALSCDSYRLSWRAAAATPIRSASFRASLRNQVTTTLTTAYINSGE